MTAPRSPAVPELDAPSMPVLSAHSAASFAGVPGAPSAPPVPDVEALRLRFERLAAALSARPTPEQRAVIKTEIVSLFRDTESAATLVLEFKEGVKRLAESWKQQEGRGGSSGTSARTAMTGRVDHLGASTYVEKGWSKLSLGDAAGAEASLRRALELAPGDNEAESLLGWAQMLQEQYDSALLTFHNVLMRDPQHALARTNVGFICLRKRIYGEAIEHLSRAIRSDSDRKATLYAHLYLGMVYREREMYDDAEPFFRRALELGPNLLQAWYELGRTRWFAGRRDDALDAWRQGAKANKFNPWGNRCAELLAEGERGVAPPRDG